MSPVGPRRDSKEAPWGRRRWVGSSVLRRSWERRRAAADLARRREPIFVGCTVRSTPVRGKGDVSYVLMLRRRIPTRRCFHTFQLILDSGKNS